MKLFFRSLLSLAICGSLIWMGAQLAEKEQRIEELRTQLSAVQRTAEARKSLLDEARMLYEAMAEQRRVQEVTVTAYNPLEDQTDEDPYVAASMRQVKAGTIAVSRDLFDQGWVFGRKVRIEGLGIFEINDLMNKRYSKRVDVFMWDKDQALAFGKRKRKVALLDI